jgi:phospholipid/cholesterol/gamma-HCH transport system substrate-binding protein
MKLSIRFADKIVGLFIILALGILVFVIFMLGSNQRWFSNDYNFKSFFSSASGLSQNMAVQYKGFTIGHVKSIRLDENDQVEVIFTIFDTYLDRVREGSLVEVLTSPISAIGGNQFLFYPGRGTEHLGEGDTIPSVGSPEGKLLLARGLVVLPERDDGINNIMKQVGTLLDTANDLLSELRGAIEGSGDSSLGRTIGSMEMTLSGLRGLAETFPGELKQNIDKIMAQLEPVLMNLRDLTDKIADPDETVMSVLDSEGNIYTDLVVSLNALSGVLLNLEKTTDILPAHLALLLADLKTTLRTAEDVLIALTNNPLLRKGIPEHKEASPSGGHARDIGF